MLAYLSSHRKSMKLKSEKAITLIALVVTILVLLILAGVSIGILSGENGPIRSAINVRRQTKIAEELENVRIAALLASGEDMNPDIRKEDIEKCLSDKFNKNITVEMIENKFLYEGENGKFLIDRSR